MVGQVTTADVVHGPGSVGAAGPNLEPLLRALSGLITPVSLPRMPLGAVRSSVLVDATELADLNFDTAFDADVLLLLGVRGAAAIELVTSLSEAVGKVILAKLDLDGAPVPVAWDRLDCAIVSVHADARWSQVNSVVDRFLRYGAVDGQLDELGANALGSHTDLFGLANTLALLINGMVSIDDEQNRVLAFSPLDEHADEIRKLSILGRAAPPGHLKVLARTGVFELLRSSGDVQELPPEGDFRRRLCIGIRDRSNGHYLGTIWVQEGAGRFTKDARDILRAGATFAARLIDHSRLIPTIETEYVQVLLGLRPSDEVVPSALQPGWIGSGSGRVVGFRCRDDAGDRRLDSREILGLLNLHATSFARGALVGPGGRRVYVVLPTKAAEADVLGWARRAAAAMVGHLRMRVGAALSAPAEAGEFAGSRTEVDRILDALTDADFDAADAAPVRTMTSMRTPVLLRDTVQHLRLRPDLRDPRLDVVAAYDAEHGTLLLESLKRLVLSGGDLKSAADAMHIHPNTLRYRLRRAGEVGGFDLDDAGSRFLVEVNMRVW